MADFINNSAIFPARVGVGCRRKHGAAAGRQKNGRVVNDLCHSPECTKIGHFVTLATKTTIASRLARNFVVGYITRTRKQSPCRYGVTKRRQEVTKSLTSSTEQLR